MIRPVWVLLGVLSAWGMAACDGSQTSNRDSVPHSGSDRIEQPAPAQSVADVGLQYAMATKQLLGKNLMSTIAAEGTVAAVHFCHVQAAPLTQQTSTQYDATIKRVSDKPRNPANAASAEELTYIAQFKAALANGEAIEPVVVSRDDQHAFYYPIVTNGMCLQCHGPANELQPQVRAAVRELYPADEAVGYNVNEVRGIWAIEFEKGATAAPD